MVQVCFAASFPNPSLMSTFIRLAPRLSVTWHVASSKLLCNYLNETLRGRRPLNIYLRINCKSSKLHVNEDLDETTWRDKEGRIRNTQKITSEARKENLRTNMYLSSEKEGRLIRAQSLSNIRNFVSLSGYQLPIYLDLYSYSVILT